jgi:GAF domain-containing protein
LPLNGQQLSTVLVDLARTLVADFSIEEILDRLVDSAVAVLDVSGAGVLLIDEAGSTRFVAASDDTIHDVERIQSEHGEGPCLDAIASGERVAIPDLGDDRRYPVFSRHAAAAGMGAVYAFPLRLDGRRLGSMDLYVARARELTADELTVGRS